MEFDGKAYLADISREFRKLKKLADGAVAQTDDAAFYTRLAPETNSIAIVLKHIAGNLRSRWQDFLTTDGEKPTRNRDSEFEEEPADTREDLLRRWEEGWSILFGVIESLSPEELERTVTIRGEPHTVVQAINRQLTHYGYHVGQIVLLARHYAGERWQTLSIAKGKSKEFNERPRAYTRG